MLTLHALHGGLSACTMLPEWYLPLGVCAQQDNLTGCWVCALHEHSLHAFLITNLRMTL